MSTGSWSSRPMHVLSLPTSSLPSCSGFSAASCSSPDTSTALTSWVWGQGRLALVGVFHTKRVCVQPLSVSCPRECSMNEHIQTPRRTEKEPAEGRKMVVIPAVCTRGPVSSFCTGACKLRIWSGSLNSGLLLCRKWYLPELMFRDSSLCRRNIPGRSHFLKGSL